ncbi:hypothetical protein HDE_12773 [Halotydeus destructor]|nr:hypothetical protein HDE_12773 [Halotydeus destructor]
MRIPTLKEVKFMSSDSKRHILFAMLNSTTETYWTTGLNIIDTHDLRVIENIEELSLVYLILRYMRQMIPFDLRHDFYHFASAIVVSIAFHMGQDNAWLRDRQNDYEVSDRDRLDCLYLFNIFQRILQLFDQINQVFQYPLPELQVHKYLNGVLIANLYQFYKSSNQQPDMF